MPYSQLSLKEKKRVKKLIKNLSELLRWPETRTEYKFAIKQVTKSILCILGYKGSTTVITVDAQEIVTDWWPFKIKRLQKLIQTYERRRQ